jgi:hypothetical protein
MGNVWTGFLMFLYAVSPQGTPEIKGEFTYWTVGDEFRYVYVRSDPNPPEGFCEDSLEKYGGMTNDQLVKLVESGDQAAFEGLNCRAYPAINGLLELTIAMNKARQYLPPPPSPPPPPVPYSLPKPSRDLLLVGTTAKE